MPIAGARQYDEFKVAGLVSVLAPLALLMLGAAWPWARMFLASSVTGALAGVATRYSTDFRAWFLQAMMTEEDKLRQNKAKTRGVLWEEDWVTAYAVGSGNSRQGYSKRGDKARASYREQSQGRDQGYQSSQESARRTEDLYDMLGVHPSASISEIQAAFRAAALKNHPDMVKGGEREKKAASERFQQIHDAYRCLRDPEKRKAYDLNQ